MGRGLPTGLTGDTPLHSTFGNLTALKVSSVGSIGAVHPSGGQISTVGEDSGACEIMCLPAYMHLPSYRTSCQFSGTLHYGRVSRLYTQCWTCTSMSARVSITQHQCKMVQRTYQWVSKLSFHSSDMLICGGYHCILDLLFGSVSFLTIPVNVAPLSLFISLIPTRENASPSLRDGSSRLGLTWSLKTRSNKGCYGPQVSWNRRLM